MTPMTTLVRATLLVGLLACFASCGGDDGVTPPAPEPAALKKVVGDGEVLDLLESAPLVVQVVDRMDRPLGGVTVAFAGAGVGHQLSAGSAVTGTDGEAQIMVTAGTEEGELLVTASVPSLPSAVFTYGVAEGHFRIPVPADDPRGIAWDGTYLWVVTGPDTNETPVIFQIDPADGAVQQSFEAPGHRPRGLTWDGEALWYSAQGTRTIYRLDPNNNGNVLLSFPSPGTRPRGLDWDGAHLWHNDAGAGDPRVYRIDPATGHVLQSLESPVTDPLGLAWDGTHLWTAQFEGDRAIVRFDPTTAAKVDSIPNPRKLPIGLTYGPDGPWLWIVDAVTCQHCGDDDLALDPNEGARRTPAILRVDLDP
jgi:glutamine cyclotransferase